MEHFKNPLASLSSKLHLKGQAFGAMRLILLTCFALTGILILLSYALMRDNSTPFPRLRFESQIVEAQGLPTSCTANPKVSTEIWKGAQAKYEALTEDKFTYTSKLCILRRRQVNKVCGRIVMLTHKRPKELENTLTAVLAEKIPSLLEIVVVWNNLDETPPKSYTSKHGVKVRYRPSERNSLNEKVRPDPTYRTQAILLSDDDVYYHPYDLEYVFQSWKKFGKNRLTGALARCSTKGKDGTWKYDGCTEDSEYSMILTNLAFVHISFLEHFSSEDPIMVKVRSYIDEKFNCEDIAMNFLVSALTCEGPMQVYGKDPYSNSEPMNGLSRKPTHMAARNKCLNDMKDLFGGMPLVGQSARLVRGPHLSN